MKRIIKSFFKVVLIVGAVLGFVLMFGEAGSAIEQVKWTGSWLLESAFCAAMLDKFYPEIF